MFDFKPLSKTDQDNFNITFIDEVVGTLFIKRNVPKPNDKVMIARDLNGNIGVRPSEKEVIDFLIGNAIKDEAKWVTPIKEEMVKKGIIKV